MQNSSGPKFQTVQEYVLSANNGRTTLIAALGAKNLYLGNGCRDLDYYTSPPTPSVHGVVYTQSVDGVGSDIFQGYESDLETLANTPAQASELVRTLCDGVELSSRTLIVMKARGEFFIGYVSKDKSWPPYVFVFTFANSGVWSTGCERRFVVPHRRS
jgi:hypothetical protein